MKLGGPSGAFTYQQTLRYFAASGRLGPECAPFNPSGGGQLLGNLRLKMPPRQFEDRRRLQRQLDSLKRRLDDTGELDAADAFQQQAHDVLLRGVAQAFDLSKEDAPTLTRYDTSALVPISDRD